MKKENRIIKIIGLAVFAGLIFYFSEANFAFASKFDPLSYKNRYLMPIYNEIFVTPAAKNAGKPKPKPLYGVAPKNPGASTDRNGNVTIRNGSFSSTADLQGNFTASLNGRTYTRRDVGGDLIEIMKIASDGRTVTIYNELGEVKGYEEYGSLGKINKSYDQDYNLTATFGYNGMSLAWMVDQLTLSRTIYDRFGRAMYDVDFEGNKTAIYEYDGNRLKWKIDIYGNKTIYNDNGWKALVTLDFEGNVIATFKYEDPGNKYRITSIVDQYNNVTEYENGRPRWMKDYQGNTLKEWVWYGTTKLLMTKELMTNEALGLRAGRITEYDVNKKPLRTTINGKNAKTWIRIKGKTVGIWDAFNRELTLVKYGRTALAVKLGNISTLDGAEAWLEDNWVARSNLIEISGKPGNPY